MAVFNNSKQLPTTLEGSHFPTIDWMESISTWKRPCSSQPDFPTRLCNQHWDFTRFYTTQTKSSLGRFFTYKNSSDFTQPASNRIFRMKMLAGGSICFGRFLPPKKRKTSTIARGLGTSSWSLQSTIQCSAQSVIDIRNKKQLEPSFAADADADADDDDDDKSNDDGTTKPTPIAYLFHTALAMAFSPFSTFRPRKFRGPGFV